MTLKTKSMRKIVEPIEIRINNLTKTNAKNDNESKTTMVKFILHEKLEELMNKFLNSSKDDGTDSEEMKMKITNVVKEFCSINHTETEEEDESTITILFEKFIKSLETLENLACLSLKQSLQEMLDYVKEMGDAKQIEDFRNIKELGISMGHMFQQLQCYRKNLVSKLLSDKIALYLCQLYSSYSMLMQLVQEQHQLHAAIANGKIYICNRISYCLQMLIDVLNGPNPTKEEESNEKDNFVYRMDLVLDIISELSKKPQEQQKEECEQLWFGIEDMFSYAMAIAQVCQPYSFKAITGACQSIISEYENLKDQLFSESPDPSLNSLFMNTLNDALYRLERKVNVSVLNLVMEVFSDPFNPLKKLVNSCGIALTVEKRCKNDLSDLIEDFDQLTDKIMQVGMFAVACCKDAARVNKVRDCLASLESLETELVPAIVAFYINPEDKELRVIVKLLTTQWQAEINKLHNTVNVIIDSAAFCEVVQDELQQRITAMSDCLDNRKGVTQQQVEGIVQRSISLSKQVTTVLNDIGNENIEKQTIMMVRELKAAILEASAASKTLLVENAPEPQQLRVIKRCELILDVVKRLQPALVIIINNSLLMSTSYKNNSGIGQGDSLHDPHLSFPSTVFRLPFDEKSSSYVRTPYTVKSHKSILTIQPANSVPRKQSDLSSLIPYIRRGRTMRTERSIMYRTPNLEKAKQSSSPNKLQTRDLSHVRQHLFSRDSFSMVWESNLSTESFDLTGILEKVTSLSDTLSSVISKTTPVNSETTTALEDNLENVAPNVSFNNYDDSISTLKKFDECSTIGGGDAPSSIETPERVEDIHRLEKKIEVLQKQIANE